LLIPLRGSPDPDSIGSAVGLQHILLSGGVTSDIAYTQPVSRPQNRMLIELLDLPLVSIGTSPSEDYTSLFQGYCLVDTPSLDPSLRRILSSKPLVVHIDHHDQEQDAVSAELSNIDTHVGAAATLLAKHLQSFDLLIVDDPKSKKVAVALMHGIYADTNALISANSPDYEAMAYLSHFFDKTVLKKILSEQITERTMHVLVNAYQHRVVSHGHLFTYLGYVSPDERDELLPTTADLFQRLAGVNTVIVGAVVGQTLQASIRNTNSQNIRNLITSMIPELPNITGASFGSRNGQGGFEIPLSALQGHDIGNYLLDRFNRYVRVL